MSSSRLMIPGGANAALPAALARRTLVPFGVLLLAAATAILCWLIPAEAPWLIALAVAAAFGMVAMPTQQISVLFPAIVAVVLLAMRWPFEHMGSFGAWIGQALVIVICCPVRPGSLHYLASWSAVTAIVAATVVGHADDSHRAAAGSTALGVAVACAGLAIAALAIDTRLTAVRGRLASAHAGGRVALLSSVLAVVLAGLLIAPWAAPARLQPASHVTEVESNKPTANASTRPGGGLRDPLLDGADVNTEIADVLARLQWMRVRPPASIPRTGTVYLKAQACSVISGDGPYFAWKRIAGESQRVANTSMAQTTFSVARSPGGGNFFLLPEDHAPVGLSDIRRDREGNWWQERLGDRPRTYAALPSDERTVTTEQRSAARAMPPLLERLPWREIEDPAWARMPPPAAFAAIAARLGQHCQYGTVRLPSAEGGPLAALQQFLFGDDGQRRGHCQYFASSTVLLMRRAGHAARLVIGVASDEIEDSEAAGEVSQIIFRAQHAHAWIEYEDNGRWQRGDPTPGTPQQRIHIAETDQNDEHLSASMAVSASRAAAAQARAAEADSHHLLLITALLSAVATLAVVVWWWLRGRQRPSTLRERLEQRTQPLIAVAVEAGMVVRSGTSLGAVVRFLEQRSGLSLDECFAAHQRARFAGSLDEAQLCAWPIAALKAALDARAAGAPALAHAKPVPAAGSAAAGSAAVGSAATPRARAPSLPHAPRN